MSSPSSPYKSKLFNFLNRQSIKVKEQVERTVRQAKVAATWGVQVIMYPIYLIFQTTRYSSYRFQQAARSTWKLQPTVAPEPPPSVDAPIQHVLEEIAHLRLTPASANIPIPQDAQLTVVRSGSAIASDPAEIAPNALEDGSTAAQLGHLEALGVASNLETRQLVLVTPSHQTVYELTPDQQHKLMKRIIWEIAVYKHNWRIWAQANRGFSPKIAPSRKITVLAPVRWFWEAMAWLQNSQVAMAIDLFHESSLKKINSSEYSLNLVLSPDITSIIEQLEIPGMAVVERQIGSLDLAIAKAETYLLSHRKYTLALPATESEVAENGTLGSIGYSRIAPSAKDPFSLQKLLLAAIDYFFGQAKDKRLPYKTASAPPLPKNRSSSLSASDELADPDTWLGLNELFPEPNQPKPPVRARKKNIPASQAPIKAIETEKPDNTKLPPQADLPERSLWGTIKSFLRLAESERLPANLAAASHRAIQESDSSADLAGKNGDVGEAIAKASNAPSLEYTPNWIEAKATSKGYVKHPLQKLLEWLDRTVLSIEEICAKIYRQLKRWFGI